MNRVQNERISKSSPLNIIKKSKTEGSEVEVVPRLKEGGAFVKISLPDGSSAKSVAESLKKYLRDANIKPWWNPLQRMRVNLVKGKPWVEDLYRLPSSRLKVEFLPTSPEASAADLSQEQLYEFFRPYGKLADIITQPPDSKVLPKFAYMDYMGIRRAAMAKNCLHGLTIPESRGGGKTGTLLRISYEKKAKSNWIKDWIFNHPRIVLPILAALVAGITVAIFDP
jgi:RNA recognition motif-containing protein